MPVKRELSNVVDPFAVVVWKAGEVVGHAPKSLSKTMSLFLNYDSNVVFCEVTGPRVNRGVGLGMEVPCVYKFMVADLISTNWKTFFLECSNYCTYTTPAVLPSLVVYGKLYNVFGNVTGWL